MKNIIIYSLFICFFSFIFVINVSASSVPINLYSLEYNNSNLLSGKYISFTSGNRTLFFDFDYADSVTTATDLYSSVVLCSDSKFTSFYSNDPSEITNISVNHTNYSCSYSNSTYTGGKVVIVNFKAFSTGSHSIVLYQSSTASIELIDFVVNSTNYVNPEDYSSQTLINQNSQIINQNTTIINQNNQQLQEQQETNDKLDEIKDMDISEEDKELPDDSSYQDYNDAEGDLIDKVNSADMDSLDIAIDTDTSNFIWDTITDLFNSHPMIMSTIIALLSIGVIKLALGR